MNRASTFPGHNTLAGAAVLVAVAAFATLGAGACHTVRPAPDIGAIYNRAAQHHDETTNPVIVIPGILGSKLIDTDSGRIVWGAFNKATANPRDPHGAQLVALPMREGVPLHQLRDNVVANGVLESLEIRLAGLPFRLNAYIDILRTLGAGGYRDEQLQLNTVDYGAQHINCFQFAYDWRRDNVENARLLYEFIREKRAFVLAEQKKRFGKSAPNLKFDLISHSMGGLIVRYLLRYGDVDLPSDGALPPLTWAGSRLVEKAVLIGPPNAGTLESVQQLVRGRRFGPLTPRYDAAILGTFPSGYQMLPRARHRALLDSSRPDSAVDLLDPDVWEELGWGLAAPEQDATLQLLLPDVAQRADRRRIALDHLRKSLERARQFQAALDRPATPPAGTRLYLVAGDAAPTPQTLLVNRVDGSFAVRTRAPGDGAVLRSSALMDERTGGIWLRQVRSPIRWTNVLFLFTDHLGLTKDPGFTDNILFLLLDEPRSSAPLQE